MSKASSTEESDMTGPVKGWTGKGVWLNLVPVPFLLAGLFSCRNLFYILTCRVLQCKCSTHLQNVWCI